MNLFMRDSEELRKGHKAIEGASIEEEESNASGKQRRLVARLESVDSQERR